MASVVTVKTEKRPSPDSEDGDTVAKKARYENSRCFLLFCQHIPKGSQMFVIAVSLCLVTCSDKYGFSKNFLIRRILQGSFFFIFGNTLQ